MSPFRREGTVPPTKNEFIHVSYDHLRQLEQDNPQELAALAVELGALRPEDVDSAEWPPSRIITRLIALAVKPPEKASIFAG